MGAVERFSSNALRRFVSALNSVRFRDEKGQIEYFGQKVVLLRSDAFSLMRKEISRVAGAASSVILGIAGRRVGAEEGRALLAKAESLGIKTGTSLNEFARIALEETNMGYGKMRLEEFDPATGRVHVMINNSFETDTGEKTLGPSCFFTLGYLEGLLSQLFNKNLRGRENSCVGKGDGVCDFDLSPSS